MIKIPQKEDYVCFVREFSEGISNLFPSTCFFTFGSYGKKDCIHGRSDIDGGLIFDSGVVTPKKDIRALSHLLSDEVSKHGIRTELSLFDRETNKDGRFLHHTSDYTDKLKKDARIHCGPDFLQEMNGLDYKLGELSFCAFTLTGLGGIRHTLLYSSCLAKKDLKGALNKILDRCGKFPKKLVHVTEGDIYENRHTALKNAERIFPELNTIPLKHLNNLLDDPHEFQIILGDRELSLSLLENSLTCVEEMIGAYLKKFPEHSVREYRP